MRGLDRFGDYALKKREGPSAAKKPGRKDRGRDSGELKHLKIKLTLGALIKKL